MWYKKKSEFFYYICIINKIVCNRLSNKFLLKKKTPPFDFLVYLWKFHTHIRRQSSILQRSACSQAMELGIQTSRILLRPRDTLYLDPVYGICSKNSEMESSATIVKIAVGNLYMMITNERSLYKHP